MIVEETLTNEGMAVLDLEESEKKDGRGRWKRTAAHRKAQSLRMTGRPQPNARGPRPHTRGANNASWKGGKSKNGAGYVTVAIDPDHPLASRYGQSHSRAYEHDLIAFEELERRGIAWQQGFTVHHRDGRKDHNVLWNLIVFFTTADHTRLENWLRAGVSEEEALARIGSDFYVILGEEPAVKTAAEVALV